MSRTLHDFSFDPRATPFTLTVVDDPGPSGASHRYDVGGFDTRVNSARKEVPQSTGLVVLFQDGPSDAGANGVSEAVLISALCDRMKGLQMGAGNCAEFGTALTNLMLAKQALAGHEARLAKEGNQGKVED